MLGEWHCAADLAAYFGCAPDDDDEPAEGAVEEVAVAPAAEPTKKKKPKKKRPSPRKAKRQVSKKDVARAAPERAVSFEELPKKVAPIARPPSPPKAPTPRPGLFRQATMGLLSLGSSRTKQKQHFEDHAGQRALSGKYGLTVEEVHARLVEALPGESLAFTRRVVRDHGTNEMGRVSRSECDQLIADVVAKRRRKEKQSRVPVPAYFREKLKGLKRHNSIPLERHENASIKLDRAALMRPLAAPYFVEWRDVIQPEINRDDLDAMFANLTDADLVRPDPLTKNTVLMYAAQTGNAVLARELLARAAVRDIVGAKNLQGVTALDYAVARGDAVVTDLISTYSKAHLDEDNIDDYLLGEHAVRGYRASRSASCAARRSK